MNESIHNTKTILLRISIANGYGCNDPACSPFASDLDVIQNKLTHANIVGLPADGQDVAKVEKLATELAGICTLIYPQNDQQNHKGSL